MKALHKKTIYEALGRHPVHPFPARMAPGIALGVILKSERPLRILDPMMGSGTVVALARAEGHRAIGIDIDPLAVLISKVWTSAVDRETLQEKSAIVLARAQSVFKTLPSGSAYPRSSDKETRRFIRYWFDDYARRQLASLAIAINRVRNPAVRDVLWCGFSRLIIVKKAGASLAMDLAHSRPHKSFETAPIKPFDNFIAAVDRVLENCISHSGSDRGPAPVIKRADARKLPIRNDSIDLVLTSPPYLNAIDYMRCSKFSLVWMGRSTAELSIVRSQSVGSEVGKKVTSDERHISQLISKLKLSPKLSIRHEGILTRFIDDMQKSLNEVSRVLAPGGKAIYVIGENTVSGTYIRNSEIVRAVAKKAGLKFQNKSTRRLPQNRRYLPPPSSAKRGATLGTRMRREVILSFRKPRPRKTKRRS